MAEKPNQFPSQGVYSTEMTFYLVFWEEINRATKAGKINYYADGIAKERSKGKVKVTLRNGSEIYAKSGMYSRIEAGAWVALLKHFRMGKLISAGNREMIVDSYEVIGVRYFTEKGLSKIYRV